VARGVVCYLLDSTNGDSLFWWALMADRPWGSREAETEDDSVRSARSSRTQVPRRGECEATRRLG